MGRTSLVHGVREDQVAALDVADCDAGLLIGVPVQQDGFFCRACFFGIRSPGDLEIGLVPLGNEFHGDLLRFDSGLQIVLESAHRGRKTLACAGIFLAGSSLATPGRQNADASTIINIFRNISSPYSLPLASFKCLPMASPALCFP